MAPLPPARTLRTQRITGQIHPLLPSKIYRTDAHVTDDFLSTKRDKRLIKHSSFVSRIASSKISKDKRRRPKNKLKASLDDLADALPELQIGQGGEEALAGKIRHRSLRSKKGALKRKERLVRGEMERFGVSMAVLAGRQGAAMRTSADERVRCGNDIVSQDNKMTTQTSGAQDASAASGTTANRWAALRGYISSTMEQNPAFAGR